MVDNAADSVADSVADNVVDDMIANLTRSPFYAYVCTHGASNSPCPIHHPKQAADKLDKDESWLDEAGDGGDGTGRLTDSVSMPTT